MTKFLLQLLPGFFLLLLFQVIVPRLYGFPLLVSVITTRNVATQHGEEWDILKNKQSKRLYEVGEEVVDLHVVLNDEEDLARMEELQSLELLSFEVLQQVGQLRNGIHKDLTCYRTVVETFISMKNLARSYPDLVAVKNIGQSFLKQQDRTKGYNIKVLVIGARNSIRRDTVDMVVVGGHHSRELPPPETLMRWAEYLVHSYGTDPDVTWILNRTNIHIVPIANPDGRKIVQDNLAWMYRKNAHPNGCARGRQFYGTDLNRNYPMFWGDTLSGAASDNVCASTYHGTGPLSEPESKAVYQYASALFDKSMKKGTAEEAMEKWNDACPTNASGIFIDVHSAGDMIYFPWGYRDVPSPNHLPLLTMSAKLAHAGDYELWGPEQDGYLYFVSGDATDAIYGMDCVFSVGYEIGSEFYAPCNEFETTIFPIMKASLLYAAKCAKAPYSLPLGPDVLTIDVNSVDPKNVVLLVEVSDNALIVDQAKFQAERDRCQPIVEVRVYVDSNPDEANNKTMGIPMQPRDGAFDEINEVAILSLDLSHLEGRHVLYVQAKDADGNVGPLSAVFVELSAKEVKQNRVEDLAIRDQTNSDCYDVDRTLCTTDFGDGCVEIEATYRYGKGNPNVTVQTSVGCHADPETFFCSVTIDNRVCYQCLVQVIDGNPEFQKVTLLDSCSALFGGYVPPNNQTIFLGDGDGYFRLEVEMLVCPSYTRSFDLSESLNPSTASSLVPSIVTVEKPECNLYFHIPGCYDDGSSTVVDCGDCYKVDVNLCKRLYSNGCRELEATYHYGEGNPNVTITTFQFCNNKAPYCEVKIEDDVCSDCQWTLDVGQLGAAGGWIQKVTIGSACGEQVYGRLPSETQTIRYFSEGVGYLQLSEDTTVCPPASAMPSESLVPPSDAPSMLPPSLVPSLDAIRESQSPSGGYFSFFDSFADGVPNDGDCYAVDFSITSEEFPSGCTKIQAFYEYYNQVGSASRERYGHINLSSTMNCGDDSCSVSSSNGKCGGCAVLDHAVVLEDCDGYFKEKSQTINLMESGGYPKIFNTDAMCSHPAIQPSTAPYGVDTLSTRNGRSEVLSKDSIVVTLKPHFSLIFFDGHENDGPPEAGDILILVERTEAYLRKLLVEEYGPLLENMELDDVQQSYYLRPQHKFELSFTTHISLKSAAVVEPRFVAELLSDGHNLREYVRNYARYIDQEGRIPNGLFRFTNIVRAKIVAVGLEDTNG